MTEFVEMPDGDPRIPQAALQAARASLQADMESAGDWDALLKRHGVARADQFRPASPWTPDGRDRNPGQVPATGPGLPPTNGGIK